MKKYERNSENPKVSRATSVFEPDNEKDDITNRYAEATITENKLSEEQESEIEQLVQKHKQTLTKKPGLTHLATFGIDTEEHSPVFQRAYNTPEALRDSMDQEIDWLLEKGFIRRSQSPRASPMVTVRKPDGTARLCVDFKKINDITTQVPFYMPRVEEDLEGFGKAEFISKLDLSKGYYQIPIEVVDIEKTAFMCHKKRYEFTRMPFGVKNAPAVFQELMQRIFEKEAEFCTPYMDDIVVFSKNWKTHIEHID